MPDYRVYIRRSDYTIIDELDAWISGEIRLRWNDRGSFAFEISSQGVASLVLNRTCGVVVTRDGTTILSGQILEFTQTANTIRFSGYDDTFILETPTRPTPGLAVPPYPDEYDVRTGVASTIMRELVDVTVGPSAPTGWIIPEITLAADPVLGATVTARARFQPLIALLRELAATPAAGGLGFRLLQTTAATLEFSVFAPTDHSEEVKFSIDLETATDFEDTWRAPDYNYFMVGLGDGLGADRTVLADGSLESYNETFRWFATFVDMRETDDTSEGQQRLAELMAGAISSRRVNIVPTDAQGLEYGTDYDLGDLVTFVVNGVAFVDVIREVAVELTQDRGALVTPMMGEQGTSNDQVIAQHIASVQGRLSNIERNWNVPDDSITAAMLRAGSVTSTKLADNAVTEPKLDALDTPADNEILTYDAATGRLEWQAINALAANLSITSLTTSGAITAGTTVTATGNVSGSRLISTVSTGTSPLQVASSTVVNNLNANYLEGHGSTDFALAGALAGYLPLTGGTISGNLAVDGNTTLGNSGTDTVTIPGDLTVNDIVASGSVTAQGLSSSGGLTLSGSTSIDGNGGTAGWIRIGGVVVAQAGFDGTEELLVNGQSRLKGSVTVTSGGIGVTGSSAFNSGLSITGGLTILTGGVDVTGASTFRSTVGFNDPATFTDNPAVVGTDLALNAAYANFNSAGGAGLSSASGFTNATFSGWFAVKVAGTVKYVPYYSTAPS